MIDSKQVISRYAALTGLDEAGEVLLEQSELCGVLGLGGLHAPDHVALGPQNPESLQQRRSQCKVSKSINNLLVPTSVISLGDMAWLEKPPEVTTTS